MLDRDLSKVIFLIPSLDPDDKMPKYVKELIDNGVKHVLVIDDGSSIECQKFFNEVKQYNEVVLLKHDVNRGKGAALKTGFKYVLDNMPDIKVIVTADADGQHATDDTINVAIRTLETNQVVFGTRNFNEEIVPFKSRNGNKITTAVFKLLYGKLVNDTQTGLRGLPIDFIPECLLFKGDRFEYEIMMLIQIVQDNRQIIEEPIKTIYYESNRATHFNTFKDSFRIYKVMLSTFIRFAGSGLLSALLDLGVYTLLINLIFTKLEINKAIMLSTIIARVISSIFNFSLNKTKVFDSKDNLSSTILKYYILAIIQMIASWLLVTFVFERLTINTSIIKVFVDAVLFIVSYQIQNRWVFRKQK